MMGLKVHKVRLVCACRQSVDKQVGETNNGYLFSIPCNETRKRGLQMIGPIILCVPRWEALQSK
jgi:hypothetical protein